MGKNAKYEQTFRVISMDFFENYTVYLLQQKKSYRLFGFFSD